MTTMRAACLAAFGVAVVLAALLFGGEAKPKTPQAAAKKEREPVHVWADRIRYLREQNLAHITGNATIIKSDLRIDADSVRATLEPQTNRFKKITATGNVRMYTIVPIAERTTKRPPLQLGPDARRAMCEIAVYDPVTGIVVLYGTPQKQPVVWVGKDKIAASVITYDRNKNILTFEEKVRITALIPKKSAQAPRPPTVPPTPPPAPR